MKGLFLTLTSLLIVIVAFLGIWDAGFLTYNEVRGIVPPCRPPFACGQVLDSPWSHVGPIPLSAVGMLYYGAVFILGILYFCEQSTIRLSKNVVFHTKTLLFLLTSCGLLFSVYLVSIMAFVIQAWCLYCLFSAALSSSLFLLSACGQFIASKKPDGFVPSFHRALFTLFYTWIAKPLFFLFDPEAVHDTMTMVGKMLGSSLLTRLPTRWLFHFSHPQLVRRIDGIVFPNPVGLSAGFDYDANVTSILPEVGFGFATIGTVTNEPYEGNTPPRLGRYPKSQALLVNKGFKNIGIREIVKKIEHMKFSIPVGISIGSTNKIHASLKDQIEDVMESFRIVERSSASHAYYELNISCPNTKGGQPFTTPDRLEKLLVYLDTLKIQRPVYIKMPIDLSDKETLSLLKTAKPHVIAGVIFGNLTKDKTNPDVHPHDRQAWKISNGNLSGKPTMKRSNHFIELTKKTFASRFTIIGTGGIFAPQDAALKLSLGADLVQLITGMIYQGPGLIGGINEYLVHQKKKE